jgi:hypothetical protein
MAVRTVARNLGNVSLGLTASPDGRTILYTRVKVVLDCQPSLERLKKPVVVAQQPPQPGPGPQAHPEGPRQLD